MQKKRNSTTLQTNMVESTFSKPLFMVWFCALAAWVVPAVVASDCSA